MKKFLSILILFFTLSNLGLAGGGLTHMFIAQESINKISDTKLRNLLKDNMDAYLVGAYYPVSGYVDGAHYGEDSHWDPFINAFADHLKQKYQDPISQNPRMVAFLFGCAAHRVSDEIIHWTFYPVIADKDFNGNTKKAHSYGDTGIDMFLNIDKNQWVSEPFDWWVPVSDLVQVYKRMGKNYSKKEIIWGNSVIATTGIGERAISAPTYYMMKWEMPWTVRHYYDWPKGGILMDEDQVSAYQMRLWKQLQDKNSATNMTMSEQTRLTSNLPKLNLHKIALPAQTAVFLQVQNNNDGSMDFKVEVK